MKIGGKFKFPFLFQLMKHRHCQCEIYCLFFFIINQQSIHMKHSSSNNLKCVNECRYKFK